MTTSPMDVRVTMLLADHAAVAEGKLYISGAGWTAIPSTPTPFAIALLVEVPWTLTDQAFPFQLRLVTADGIPVSIGDQGPVQIEATVRCARPLHALAGSRVPVPLAFTFVGLALPPAQRLVWELVMDGRVQEEWRLSFDVQPRPVT